MVEVPPPLKKQNRGPEQPPIPLKARELKTQVHMRLHPDAGDSGTAMVADYVKFLVEGCSSIAPKVWGRFKANHIGGLVNLGLMSSLVVSSLYFNSLPCLLKEKFYLIESR